MIAHVGTGRRSGNRQRRPQRDSSIVACILDGRPIAAVGWRFRVLAGRTPGSFQVWQLIPAEPWSEYKRCRFPLLPGQFFSRHQIQGSIDDVVGPSVAHSIPGKLRGSKRFQFKVVLIAEAGKGLGLASRVGGSQKTPNKPIPIEMVQREFVDIHAQRQEHRQE